jgi:hypothetical protein
MKAEGGGTFIRLSSSFCLHASAFKGATMISFRRLSIIPAFAVLAACGGNDRDDQSLDAGLRDDLALAASAQQFPPMQYMSPMEQGYAPGYAQPAAYGYPGYPAQRPVAQQPVVYRAPAPVARRAPAAPAPAAEPIRNTKRDAIIGATAGAVIGATTSRDRLKGAVIGAAAGGILGGIIGHTVDVKRP